MKSDKNTAKLKNQNPLQFFFYNKNGNNFNRKNKLESLRNRT